MLRSAVSLALALVGCMTPEAALPPDSAGRSSSAATDLWADSTDRARSAPALQAGAWSLTTLEVVEDTCDFAGILDRVDARVRLPTPLAAPGGPLTFTLDPLVAGAGLLDCTQDGFAFDCEARGGLSPRAPDVEVAGEVLDGGLVSATLLVAWPGGTDLPAWADSPRPCTQVLDVELELLGEFEADDVGRPGGRRVPLPPT